MVHGSVCRDDLSLSNQMRVVNADSGDNGSFGLRNEYDMKAIRTVRIGPAVATDWLNKLMRIFCHWKPSSLTLTKRASRATHGSNKRSFVTRTAFKKSATSPVRASRDCMICFVIFACFLLSQTPVGMMIMATDAPTMPAHPSKEYKKYIETMN